MFLFRDVILEIDYFGDIYQKYKDIKKFVSEEHFKSFQIATKKYTINRKHKFILIIRTIYL